MVIKEANIIGDTGIAMHPPGITRIITRDGQDYHPTKGWRGPRQNARKTRQFNHLAAEKTKQTKRWLSNFISRNR